MTRAQMDHLAGLLRGIHVELKAAPAEAHRLAAARVTEFGPAGLIVGPHPFALGTLEARVEHIAAQLEATVHVYLERRPKRKR